MIIRTFEVHAPSMELLCNIGRYTDEKLCSLQRNGWEIINIYPVACKEYHYPNYYDSVVYVITAKHLEENNDAE